MAKFNKEKLFEELNSKYKQNDVDYLNKLKRFDSVVKRAKTIVDLIYGDRKTNVSKTTIQKQLIEEYYQYQGSIIKSFRNVKTRTIDESFERAKQLRTKDRFEVFIKMFGEETYHYNGKEKTLKGWENQYMNGKISAQEFYLIIEAWKIINEDIMNEYYRAHDINQAITDAKGTGYLY